MLTHHSHAAAIADQVIFVAVSLVVGEVSRSPAPDVLDVVACVSA